MNIGNLKLAIVMCALAPLTTMASESVDERREVAADATVSVENIVGEIEIQAWDRNEIHLTGRLGDSVEELEIIVTSSGLEITVINRDERNIDETNLNLKVPATVKLVVSAVSADIEISGMDNDKLTAGSVSGDVLVRASSQWVSLESVSGNVEFSGQTARISAESVSGDIELSGISGRVDATTVSGDMEVVAGIVDSGSFETVSGDIRVEMELSDSGKLRAESMSGDVTVRLPDSQAGLFKAQTFSGRISTDFGSVSSAKHGPGSHLKYAAGNGGAEIRVESFSGNIKLQGE